MSTIDNMRNKDSTIFQRPMDGCISLVADKKKKKMYAFLDSSFKEAN